MEYYIYGLSSSKDNIIRYVGQTKNSLNARLNEHKCDALTRLKKNHKCNWIRKVYNDGYEIQIHLIEIANEFNWQNREIYWISKYREAGNIVNQLDGGQSGGLGGKLFQYTYNETKEFLVELGVSFNSFKEYKKFLYQHSNEFKGKLPFNPKKVFTARNEWVSWGDFFSNQYVSDKEKHKLIVSYDEAKKIMKANNITNMGEYNLFIVGRNDLPLFPRSHYKNNGWINHYDFFNKEKIIKCDYQTFCRYISINFGKLMPRNKYEELFRSGKLSNRLPSHPHRLYCKKWSEIKKDIEKIS